MKKLIQPLIFILLPLTLFCGALFANDKLGLDFNLIESAGEDAGNVEMGENLDFFAIGQQFYPGQLQDSQLKLRLKDFGFQWLRYIETNQGEENREVSFGSAMACNTLSCPDGLSVEMQSAKDIFALSFDFSASDFLPQLNQSATEGTPLMTTMSYDSIANETSEFDYNIGLTLKLKF